MAGHHTLARRAGTSLIFGALLALSGCTQSNSDPLLTAVSESPTATPSAAVESAPSETPAPAMTSAAPTATLLDVNGEWCPTSPADWNEPCFSVDLPQVAREGFDGLEYVYPQGTASDDPRHLTDADYEFGSNEGQCWSAGIDGYPALSGAAFLYCPAGALSGLEWIDDPTHSEDLVGLAESIADYTGQDRVYAAQEITAYPYVRADA